MRLFFCVVLLSVVAVGASACDSCRCNLGDPETGGASGITAGVGSLRKMLNELRVRNAIKEGDTQAAAPATNAPNLPPKETIESPTDQAMAELERGAPTASHRWTASTSFEYRNWKRINPLKAFNINDSGAHTHDLMDDFFITEHIGYAVTDDLSVGVSQGFKHMRQQNVEDLDVLGRHEYLNGFGDLTFDVKYRFLRQSETFPVDVAVFGDIKPPTGEQHERNPDRELFDQENQPGTGSWDGTIGMSTSKRWGTWGASGSISYSIHGQGEQHFKAGNFIRTTLGMGKLLPWQPHGWKLFANLGGQDIAEFRGRENGEVDRNHGGQTLFVIPGLAARPNDRLIMSVSAPIPVYQDLVGTHQKQNYTLSFGIGVRF